MKTRTVFEPSGKAIPVLMLIVVLGVATLLLFDWWSRQVPEVQYPKVADAPSREGLQPAKQSWDIELFPLSDWAKSNERTGMYFDLGNPSDSAEETAIFISNGWNNHIMFEGAAGEEYTIDLNEVRKLIEKHKEKK